MKVLLLIVLFLAIETAQAQDPQFSQFYANPLYHNPAFAGNNGESRFIVNYRNQWPALGANYQSYAASFDTYLDPGGGRLGLGLGIQALHDSQGNFMRTNGIALQGSLDAPLVNWNNGLQIDITGAGQISYTSSLINPGGLTFVDQFLGGGFTPVSLDPLAQVGLSRNIANVGVGTIIEVSNPREQASFWVGGTLHNVGRSQARGDVAGQRLGLQAGITLPLNNLYIGGERGTGNEADRLRNISLTANYRQQGPDRQLDAGINLLYDPVMVGVWYRGIPLRKFNQTSQRDAVIVMAGLQLADFPIQFQYSYDITVSSLRWASGGAHEITVWYKLDGPWSLSSGRRQRANRQRKCIRF
jgi:type IX secretion system PorP/SprF family membrane protein